MDLSPAKDYQLVNAASVVLLRQVSTGPEVLLLKRSSRLSFGPDCWVFPGGKVESKDGENDEQRHLNAAIRETYEEAGLILRPEQLCYVMKITTPTGKVRFKTAFYSAQFQGEREVTVDGIEIVDFTWIKPAEALAQFNSGIKKLMVPTGLLLMRLSMHQHISPAIASLFNPPNIDLKPVFKPIDDQHYATLYPGDAEYDRDINLPAESQHRCVLNRKTERWIYIHQCDAEQFPPLDGGYSKIY